MEFKELMNKRRSIRKYEAQPIPTRWSIACWR